MNFAPKHSSNPITDIKHPFPTKLYRNDCVLYNNMHKTHPSLLSHQTVPTNLPTIVPKKKKTPPPGIMFFSSLQNHNQYLAALNKSEAVGLGLLKTGTPPLN